MKTVRTVLAGLALGAMIPLAAPVAAIASSHSYPCAWTVPAHRGESLRELVARHYGRAVEVHRIARANGIADPDAPLHRGRYVCLPAHAHA